MKRKKAFIYNWWIASDNERFKFVDITNKDNIKDEYFVYGFSKFFSIPEFQGSKNPIKIVTRKGIYTASGRFYPFKTAHPLYLMFLNKIHTNNDTLIVSRWECIDETKHVYIADIEDLKGKKQEDVILECESEENDKMFLIGKYNNSTVIFNPFDMRSLYYCKKGSYSIEMYYSAHNYQHLMRKSIKDLRKNLKKQKRKKDMDL